jgi:hypothetical protein
MGEALSVSGGVQVKGESRHLSRLVPTSKEDSPQGRINSFVSGF